MPGLLGSLNDFRAIPVLFVARAATVEEGIQFDTNFLESATNLVGLGPQNVDCFFLELLRHIADHAHLSLGVLVASSDLVDDVVHNLIDDAGFGNRFGFTQRLENRQPF